MTKAKSTLATALHKPTFLKTVALVLDAANSGRASFEATGVGGLWGDGGDMSLTVRWIVCRPPPQAARDVTNTRAASPKREPAAQ
jgi:hypothetical protein